MRLVVFGADTTPVRRSSAFRENTACRGGSLDAQAIYEQAQRRDSQTLAAIAAAFPAFRDAEGKRSVILVSSGFVDDPSLRAAFNAVLRRSLERGVPAESSATLAAPPAIVPTSGASSSDRSTSERQIESTNATASKAATEGAAPDAGGAVSSSGRTVAMRHPAPPAAASAARTARAAAPLRARPPGRIESCPLEPRITGLTA